MKPKPDVDYTFERKLLPGEQVDLNLDANNEELMNMKIHIFIELKNISIINFLPLVDESEKYFLEIKASTRSLRRTNPETYDNFSKSVINEFIPTRDLRENRMIYIGLWQAKNGEERFLGDFYLDLTP